MTLHKVTKPCDECNKPMRNFKVKDGKLLCYKCWKKITSVVPFGYSLLEILEREYFITAEMNTNGKFKGQLKRKAIYIPIQLMNRRFKIVLIE